MTKTEKQYLGAALKGQKVAKPLTVTRRDWLMLDEPELHLTLSNGATVRVQWNLDHSAAFLAIAATPDAEFVDCTAAETGLEPLDLAEAVDAVYRAVRAEEDERMSDDDGADYAMDSEAARDRGDCP